MTRHQLVLYDAKEAQRRLLLERKRLMEEIERNQQELRLVEAKLYDTLNRFLLCRNCGGGEADEIFAGLFCTECGEIIKRNLVP